MHIHIEKHQRYMVPKLLSGSFPHLSKAQKKKKSLNLWSSCFWDAYRREKNKNKTAATIKKKVLTFIYGRNQSTLYIYTCSDIYHLEQVEHLNSTHFFFFNSMLIKGAKRFNTRGTRSSSLSLSFADSLQINFHFT